MTTTEFINSNPTLEESLEKGLIFDDFVKGELDKIQGFVKSNFRISPIQLVDGRWAIRGDVVMDTKNGVYKELFQYTTDEVLNMCELVDFSYILSMLPVPDDEELM